jgi:hypothetical protein
MILASIRTATLTALLASAMGCVSAGTHEVTLNERDVPDRDNLHVIPSGLSY